MLHQYEFGVMLWKVAAKARSVGAVTLLPKYSAIEIELPTSLQNEKSLFPIDTAII